MATFDDKSIFGKRESIDASAEPKKELDEELLEEDTIEEDQEEQEEELSLDEDDSLDAKVIGEELVESDKVRKTREKREAKEKKLAEKQYNKMVKNHRKAMKKNPENIKRYDTDPEKGLPDEVVDRRILDNLVNVTKKGLRNLER